jgi:hypothetical protein
MTRAMTGRWITIAGGVAIGTIASCTDIPSDPKVPFAIEFNRAPAPGTVLGQPMFDSLGNDAPLRAIAYNSNGDAITDAAITYHVVPDDSVPVTVDPITGVVTAKSDPAFAGKTARVYAQAAGLQSGTVTVTATRSADTLIGVTRKDSVVLRFANTDSLLSVSGPSVLLRHNPATPGPAADSAVPAYLVRFRIVQPAAAATDTSYLMLTGDGRKRSELDTTDANGGAGRQIRIRRVNFPFAKPAAANDTIYDTVLVRASAVQRGGARVPGADSLFMMIVKARAQ